MSHTALAPVSSPAPVLSLVPTEPLTEVSAWLARVPEPFPGARAGIDGEGVEVVTTDASAARTAASTSTAPSAS
ncbi:hypothetical protein ACOCJ4_10330 [Knoellia sp. CPCC 206435]|uniref:hypothetical protein n=1 Tax=Knoellia terrae TaxID=3404797 RepID=UPI003B434122